MSSPIIVGLALRPDDSAPLALARRLARLADAPLALVTTCLSQVPTPMPTPEYALALRDEARTRLDAVARTLADEVEVTTHVEFGSPAGVMHDLAERLAATAVVVGSTHRGPVGRLLIGDVAAGLLHGSPCPVAVAPRGYDAAPDAQLRRVGVAFDGSPESREALACALAVARRTDGSVSSFTVLEPIDWTGAYAAPGWVPLPAAEAVRNELAQSIAQRVLEALPDDGALASAEVLHGGVTETLAGVSHELDLLVCGSRGYGALRRVLAGSVSRGLAHTAACPLLVVPRQLSPSAAALARLGGTEAAAREQVSS
jgi:nucleotide-binding universal stress UspA family protein